MMVKVEGLTVTYGQETALNDVNLQLAKNTTCALIGPSGCGKTTLVYALAGLLSPDAGVVRINGQVLKGVRQNTGVILQEYGLLPWKTVWDNVALGLKVRNISDSEINRTVNDLLTKLKILEFKDKYPSELSGGQRQRVAIGRTLAIKPDLLLMDEPFSSLDAITKEELQNLILKLYQSEPKTIVFVTHNINEAVFLGQKIVVMEQAGIAQTLSNPYFGEQDLREKMEYYKMCLKVRRALDKGGGTDVS